VDSQAVLVDDMPSEASEDPSAGNPHAALVDDIVASLSTTAALNDILYGIVRGVVPAAALAACTAQQTDSASD
jgi:hypothetical protein